MEAIQRYLRGFLVRGNKPGSVRGYAYDLQRWCRFLGSICPILQIDPGEVWRLFSLVANLEDQLAEAEMYGWGGTVDYLKSTLVMARDKVASVRRSAARPLANLTDLGIPTVRSAEKS